ncbi:M1-specific T cell receptor alpha chain-like isoform 2-T2 [Liasis olivaceus]
MDSWLFFFCFHFNFWVSISQVTQTPLYKEVKEGDWVTINCNFSTAYSYFHWYRQVPRMPLSYLLSITSSQNVTEKGLRAEYLDKGQRSCLHLPSSLLQDSGTYFCAVNPQLDTRSFLFGSGTRLIVLPDLTNSEPSVYQLEDKKESNVTACLVTDFSPNPIGVKIKKTDSDAESFNGSVVVVKEDDSEGSASLGVVRWGKADDEFHCSATYQGKDYDVKEEKGSCSADEMSSTPVFETDERLNLLSLTVLGLRVIFIKSVALNLILTYRAWSR